MTLRFIHGLTSGKETYLEKSWRGLEKISPRLPEAVIASEDQRFLEHFGFDWDAMLSAVSINERGKRRLGASTITQQTAKNLFLWPSRTWTRKALEAYFSLLMELLWSKHRILEVYLNILETGDGIYGVEAASQKYFSIPAAELDENQAALLAAILPNPRFWSPTNPTAYLLRRQAWILRQMKHRGPLPPELSVGPVPKSHFISTLDSTVKNPILPYVPQEDSFPEDSLWKDSFPLDIPPESLYNSDTL